MRKRMGEAARAALIAAGLASATVGSTESCNPRDESSELSYEEEREQKIQDCLGRSQNPEELQAILDNLAEEIPNAYDQDRFLTSLYIRADVEPETNAIIVNYVTKSGERSLLSDLLTQHEREDTQDSVYPERRAYDATFDRMDLIEDSEVFDKFALTVAYGIKNTLDNQLGNPELLGDGMLAEDEQDAIINAADHLRDLVSTVAEHTGESDFSNRVSELVEEVTEQLRTAYEEHKEGFIDDQRILFEHYMRSIDESGTQTE